MTSEETKGDRAGENRRAHAISRMNDALRVEYERLGIVLVKTDTIHARNRYEIGLIVKRVADAATYGANAVKLLSVALAQDKDSLYEAARVVTCWTKEEFEERLHQPTPDSRPLSFSHFALLASVTNRAKREELLERCWRVGPSVRQLERMVRSGKRPGRARHPTRVVRSFIAHAKAAMAWLDELEPTVASRHVTRRLLEEAAVEHRLLVARLEAALTRGREPSSTSLNVFEEEQRAPSSAESKRTLSVLWGGRRSVGRG